MNEKTKQKIESTEKFFKEAFCIDGEATMLFNTGDFKVGAIIQMTDSHRGTFYVAQVEPKNPSA